MDVVLLALDSDFQRIAAHLDQIHVLSAPGHNDNAVIHQRFLNFAQEMLVAVFQNILQCGFAIGIDGGGIFPIGFKKLAQTSALEHPLESANAANACGAELGGVDVPVAIFQGWRLVFGGAVSIIVSAAAASVLPSLL